MSEQRATKTSVDEHSNQPKMFGDYLLLTRFAKGGMGEVYLAKTGSLRGLERFCVLKKLRADVQHEEEYLRRFLDEARLVLQLSHSNICHVFDVGQVGDELYLAMEYVSGANLRDLYLRCQTAKRPLSDGFAAYIASELLEALDYAHRFKHSGSGQSLNIVHRDVSPQNILLSFEGEIKLIDFGLAESEMKTEQTESQVVMGKVAYMSPEQARGDLLGPASDQFSAAILLYELLANKRYYGELSNYQIWQVVGSGEFSPKAFKSLPDELQEILEKALSANPEHRFRSCGEMKDHLDLYLRKHHPQMNKKRLREKMSSFYKADQEQEQAFIAQFSHLYPVDYIKQRSENSAKTALSLIDGGKNNNTDKHPYFVQTAKHNLAQDPKSNDNNTADEASKIASLETHFDTSHDIENTEAAAQKATARTKKPLAFILFILLFLLSLPFFWWIFNNAESKEQPSEKALLIDEMATQQKTKNEAILDKSKEDLTSTNTKTTIATQVKTKKKTLQGHSQKKKTKKKTIAKTKDGNEANQQKEPEIKKEVIVEKKLADFNAQNATKWVHVLPYLKKMTTSSCAQTFLNIYTKNQFNPQTKMGASAYSIRNCVLKSYK